MKLSYFGSQTYSAHQILSLFATYDCILSFFTFSHKTLGPKTYPKSFAFKSIDPQKSLFLGGPAVPSNIFFNFGDTILIQNMKNIKRKFWIDLEYFSQNLIKNICILSIVDKFVMLRIFPDAPGCARAHPGAPGNETLGVRNGFKIYWKYHQQCNLKTYINYFQYILKPFLATQYFISGRIQVRPNQHFPGRTWVRPGKSVT